MSKNVLDWVDSVECSEQHGVLPFTEVYWKLTGVGDSGCVPGLSSSAQSLSLSISPAQTAAWRKQIFQQLSDRTKRELENFRHYEQAIEQVGSEDTYLLSAKHIY